MRYIVTHETTYRYSQPVTLSQHLVHLMPRDTPGQRRLDFRLSVEPVAMSAVQDTDYFGNPIHYLMLAEDHMVLRIAARSEVAVNAPAMPDAAASMPWDRVQAHLLAENTAQARDAIQYCFDSPLTLWTRDLPSYALASFPDGRPLLEGALDLMRRIHTEFRYDPSVTDVSTPVDEVFDLRAGVCQDLAHVQIACLRAIGLPARYVSGYLRTRPPEGQERLVGADASHAWVSVYSPGQGWVDLDPTNNLVVGDEHITCAWGRDYGDVSPINGVITGGGAHAVDVAVDVAPA